MVLSIIVRFDRKDTNKILRKGASLSRAALLSKGLHSGCPTDVFEKKEPMHHSKTILFDFFGRKL